ncbi:MAG TPA: DUF4398 domain-containing protein [Cellvibrio sp.]|nr:DUF4398 domain-containing protein [Cellvibrio sp.]
MIKTANKGKIEGVRASGLRAASMRVLLVTALVSEAVFLGACSSTPPVPKEALRAAELAIDNADQARVADYASPELKAAREKLTSARIAVEKEDMVGAARLAEEAKADADLATARASVGKAKEINDELQKGNSVLKQELQRNTGAQ